MLLLLGQLWFRFAQMTLTNSSVFGPFDFLSMWVIYCLLLLINSGIGTGIGTIIVSICKIVWQITRSFSGLLCFLPFFSCSNIWSRLWSPLLSSLSTDLTTWRMLVSFSKTSFNKFTLSGFFIRKRLFVDFVDDRISILSSSVGL